MQTLVHVALGNAAVAGAMALLLLPAARLLRRPALTHALSLLILLKLVTPPLFNVPLIWPAPPAGDPAPEAVRPTSQSLVAVDSSQSVEVLVPAEPEPAAERATAAPAPSPVSRPWASLARHALRLASSPWVALAWAATSALYAAVILLRIARLRRAVRGATVPGEDLSEEVAALARRIGLTAAPEVRFVSGLAPPMLLALFGRPIVLIPAALWSRLDEFKRQTLLLHELAHLRRRDHWVRYLELAATCAYWWHPAAWWARSALREAEEQCCDAWVIWAMPGARRTYMTTLLDAVDFISESVRPSLLAAPVLASGMGQFQHLQRRLTMVRERSVQRRLSRGGLAAVVLSAVALPLGPRLVRADDPAPAPPPGERQPVPLRYWLATDKDNADADPRAREPAPSPAGIPRAGAEEPPATDAPSAGSTGSTSSPQAGSASSPQAGSPQAGARRSGPAQARSDEAPPPTYERSGMSRVESLDAQLKAARMEIEALQEELAATKAAASPASAAPVPSPVGVQPAPYAQATAPVAPAPAPAGRISAIRPDGTVVEIESPRVLIVDPASANKPVPPAPKLAIRYDNGKLQAVTIPGEKIVWVTEVGPLGTIQSVDGARIIIQSASGKMVTIGVTDGRILEEKPVVVFKRVPPATPAKPGAMEYRVVEPAYPAKTEQRLEMLEAELHKLNATVDRLAKAEAERAGRSERSDQAEKAEKAEKARDAAENEYRRADKAASEPRAAPEPAAR